MPRDPKRYPELEPIAATEWDDGFVIEASKAISLKRIADSLDILTKLERIKAGIDPVSSLQAADEEKSQ